MRPRPSPNDILGLAEDALDAHNKLNSDAIERFAQGNEGIAATLIAARESARTSATLALSMGEMLWLHEETQTLLKELLENFQTLLREKQCPNCLLATPWTDSSSPPASTSPPTPGPASPPAPAPGPSASG